MKKWEERPVYSHDTGRYYGVLANGQLVTGPTRRGPWTPSGPIMTIRPPAKVEGQENG